MLRDLHDIELLLTSDVVSADPAQLQRELESLVQQLIDRDFPLLMQALYKVDVDEAKLKLALQGDQDDPARIIAAMILERWKEKSEARARFRQDESSIPPEDRW